MVVLDVVLELSVEQLIDALNKKLFMECTRVQAQVPPISRDSVARVAIEVRTQGSVE
jgi:ACT domain-containing protein